MKTNNESIPLRMAGITIGYADILVILLIAVALLCGIWLILRK